MNEFIETLGAKVTPLRITIPNAKDVLERGLKYFIGDKAKWLDGYDEIAEWLQDNDRRGILLMGENGLGKSLMVRQILPVIFNYYIKDYKTFVTRGIDLRRLQNQSREYFDMITSRIVCVDDFGVEDVATNYGEHYDVFSDVVDTAEIDKRILVLSTNLVPKEIQTRYGLRTLDRLRALTKPVCLIGESMRGT